MLRWLPVEPVFIQFRDGTGEAPLTGNFGDVATRLARNPLGIIALFIVLVYAMATIVVGAVSLTASDRTLLIYFMVGFPVLVLGVFAWLVVGHSGKLFAPADFKDEANYIRALKASASLGAAAVANGKNLSTDQLAAVVESVRDVTVPESRDTSWRRHVLWVDDRPSNNINERQAFESMGVRFTLAQSTEEALAHLATNRFGAIISDMGRREGPDEGYVLLEKLRAQDDRTPLFIYAGSGAMEHRREAAKRGAQGSTNNSQELFQDVMHALLRG